ncbi:hypothetical protein [Mycobacterium noviomagense]|uniref:hypothetical protein n=1 Tax=Mycobacterium noviomagense TaxID=459858 RepID=UPI0013D024AB|nr:hypothetical protein [Mycobacterium noviomagense]
MITDSVGLAVLLVATALLNVTGPLPPSPATAATVGAPSVLVALAVSNATLPVPPSLRTAATAPAPLAVAASLVTVLGLEPLTVPTSAVPPLYAVAVLFTAPPKVVPFTVPPTAAVLFAP